MTDSQDEITQNWSKMDTQELNADRNESESLSHSTEAEIKHKEGTSQPEVQQPTASLFSGTFSFVCSNV